MTDHTPWMRHDMEAGTIVTVEKPGRIIAICDGVSFSDVENQAHADLILRAVNSHDALVEALESFLKMYVRLAESGDCGYWDAEEEDEVVAARAALAQHGSEK